MNICIAAGGSGGHLFPAQQLARFFPHVSFMGHGLQDSPFFYRENIFYEISSAPPAHPLRFLMNVSRGVGQSIRLLRNIQPDVVVGFGSFHTVPILIAAVLIKCPIVLFEANCQLGKVNRLFMPFAKRVAMQFALSEARSHFRLVPLLPWESRDSFSREHVLRELGLDPERPTVLVFGGSQGASFLNRVVPLAIPPHLQIIHLSGSNQARPTYAQNAFVQSFEPNMARLYAAADIAICRAGAGTLAELIRYELPALLIPFSASSNQHQRANAEFLAKNVQGATMLNQDEATPLAIAQSVEQLLSDRALFQNELRRFRRECEGRIPLWEQIKNLC
jgi:UDP-N-acetylglucosamine--N-acetylmuramyl-(pentapeptide) pyrophosphoryl-undecaprenol N-acetylglucosamine transferase